MSRTQDDELMIRVQQGDSSAFAELVERHQGRLKGFLLKYTRDAQLAEDLTQETLLRVYSQAWDYLPLGRFTSWMYRIARNLLIDDHRKSTRDALMHSVGQHHATEDQSDFLQLLADDCKAPTSNLDEAEFVSVVDELIDQLPEEQKMTFVLHHFVNLNLAEVSDILETNVSTSKSRLRLAREKLQEKLHRKGMVPQHLESP